MIPISSQKREEEQVNGQIRRGRKAKPTADLSFDPVKVFLFYYWILPKIPRRENIFV